MTMAHHGSAGPHVALSAAIGWGAWGARIAGRVAELLRTRSPELAPAFPVLSLTGDEPDALERMRAHLRAGRMAHVIRTLERQGLISLDPVVSPPTHVYLIASLADDPDLSGLQRLADLVRRAGANLKVAVRPALLLDLGGRDDPPSPAGLNLPVFLTEPVTSHGLALQPEEYEEAMAELVACFAQPGASQMLAGARTGTGTVGVAWMHWHPAALRTRLVRRLTRDALARFLETEAPSPEGPTGLRQSEVWQLQRPSQRTTALLDGLPFTPADAPGEPAVSAPRTLLGDPYRREHRARHLRRCSAVLERRAQRWERTLQRSATGQAQREETALHRALSNAIGSGPGGFSRARHLLSALRAEANARLHRPLVPVESPRLAGRLRDLHQAESAPAPGQVAMLLGIALVLISLALWALNGTRLTMLLWAGLLAAAGAGYAWYRAWRIRRATDRALRALLRRAEALVNRALHQKLGALDLALEQRCRSLSAQLDEAETALREACRADPGEEPDPAAEGALSLPLVGDGMADLVCRDLQPLLPELTERLRTEGCLDLWRDPPALMDRAQEVTEAFLEGHLAPDPGQVAARAYGDRLGDRLHEAVTRLLDWSRPLLAPPFPLPEGQRWLFWPEGLPCPAVPADVQVLTAARGCAAAVTIIDRLPGDLPRKDAAAVRESPA